ncbi:MAG: endolytic transglycosylase MltG [Syntrophaceae bacterium]|nr:endolytic transglycosylase MltG [Syntrophaceae bacterium]
MTAKKTKWRAFLLFLAGIAFLLLTSFLYFSFSPVDDLHVTSTVEIPRGTGFVEIVDILEKTGLVQNKPFFYVLAVLKRSNRQIRAGEYELASSMSPNEIIGRLVRGMIKGYKVTIPEDWSLQEIADLLASPEFRLVDRKTFLATARDREFLDALNIRGASAEGYLFPNTYIFDRTMGAREIIKAMVHQFWKAFTPEMRNRAEQMGLNVHEAVTLASLIGKETGLKSEKNLISAVFHNRLRREMKLQCDPTAVYDLERFSGAVKRRHLQRKSPYNTYVIDGLPPGPIANPGADSLQAALHPASSDVLYFVSRLDGSHEFSRNYLAHNEAIIKYRRIGEAMKDAEKAAAQMNQPRPYH